MGFGNDFLDIASKEQAKINRWDYIKQQNFYAAKEMISKMKYNLWNRKKNHHHHGLDKYFLAPTPKS